ncbi:hypothetical protein diail_8183 [Diaporthe ilicicola]|nr:hypothetical protein diail_8183 [Diaporthe ilicicola]
MNSHNLGGGTVQFSPIEHNDHAGYLWIVSILGMIYSSLSALARARIKLGIYGVDDYLLGFATLLLYAQSAVLFYGLKNGLAKSEEITSEHQWPIAGKFLRWQIITAFDIVTEILICSLPVVFVWSNTMSFCLKFQVFLAFAFRLPLVALSLAHLSLFEQYVKSPQPLFRISDSILAQQVMLTYSLISATIPNLKSFLKSFSTGLGVSFGFMDKDLDASSEAYALQTLTAHSGRRRNLSPGNLSPGHIYDGADDRVGRQQPMLRPGSVQHEVLIHHSPDAGSDRGSSATEDARQISRCGSRDMIIKKEVQWNVHHEPA